MVNSTYYIKHPLLHGGTAATWWVIQHLVHCIISVTVILLLAISTPWNEEFLHHSLLPIVCILGLTFTQRFITKFASNQIDFHTPGYLGAFKIDEQVKHSGSAINQITSLVITFIILTTFYLANPNNDTYSALVFVYGWVYTITSLINLGRNFYFLSVIMKRRNKENWRLFLPPLVGILVVAPLYINFPAFTSTPANTALANYLLSLIATGYLCVWWAMKCLRYSQG